MVLITAYFTYIYYKTIWIIQHHTEMLDNLNYFHNNVS